MRDAHAVDFLETLKKEGFRLTDARKALVAFFARHEKPQTAAEILVDFKKRSVSADKTTIYREVAFLLERGFLKDVDFGDGQKRYEVAEGHHHHVICSKCNKIEDVELDHDLDVIEKAIARRTKFKILTHSLEFFGLCGACKP